MLLSSFYSDRADPINLESGTDITIDLDLKMVNNSGYLSSVVSALTDKVDFVWYGGTGGAGLNQGIPIKL